MATKVYMEALSPTMEEGRIVKWLKRENESVTDGDVLAEVETDKAIMELQARGEGTLRKVLAVEGDTVEVGTMIGVIAANDEDIAGILATVGVTETEQGQTGGASPDEVSPQLQTAEPEPTAAPTGPASSSLLPADRVKSSPLARRLAKERQVDLRVIQGTGPGGRMSSRTRPRGWREHS